MKSFQKQVSNAEIYSTVLRHLSGSNMNKYMNKAL